MGVGLLTVDAGAIRQSHADRRRLHTAPRGISQRRTKVEKLRPLPRILGAGNFSVGAVDDRVGAVSYQTTWDDLSGVQLFSHHGFDGVTPKGNHRTDYRRVVCHNPPSLLLL